MKQVRTEESGFLVLNGVKTNVRILKYYCFGIITDKGNAAELTKIS